MRNSSFGFYGIFKLIVITVLFGYAAIVLTCRPPTRPSSFRFPTHRHQKEQSVSAHKKPTEQLASPSQSTTHPQGRSPQPGAPNISRPVPAPRIAHPIPLPEEISRGSSSSSKIALTFDAGADSAPTPAILETLKAHGVHSTFFLTGRWVERNPQLTRRIAAEGHEIANHSYSHRRFTALTDSQIADELEKTDTLVQNLTGHSTKPFVRLPYGDRNQRVLSTLKNLGYTSIYWDLDSWDSVKPGITAEEIHQRVVKGIRNGSIVLMHCGSAATAEALDAILEDLDKAGYQPVTVSNLLAKS